MSQASCCFQHWHLGGADVLQRKGSFHALASACCLIFLNCIFKWKGWSCVSVLHMEAWVLGCRWPFHITVWVFTYRKLKFILQLNRCYIWWTRWICPVPLAQSLPDPPWWACSHKSKYKFVQRYIQQDVDLETHISEKEFDVSHKLQVWKPIFTTYLK